MDCTQAKEIMWEKDLPEQFFEHIEVCPECRREYELVKKTKTALSSKEDLTQRIVFSAKAQTRRRTFLTVTRIAAVFIAVFAVGIFAKIAMDSGMKRSNDCESDFAPEFELKAESTTSDGSVGVLDGVADVPEEPMASPDCEDVYDQNSAEEESGNTKNEVFRDDAVMLLNVYKDMQKLSSHTADIVVSGKDIERAENILSKLGVETNSSHIEISGDFYFEVQELLSQWGFEIILASSSESINQTIVYFEDLIK